MQEENTKIRVALESVLKRKFFLCDRKNPQKGLGGKEILQICLQEDCFLRDAEKKREQAVYCHLKKIIFDIFGVTKQNKKYLLLELSEKKPFDVMTKEDVVIDVIEKQVQPSLFHSWEDYYCASSKRGISPQQQQPTKQLKKGEPLPYECLLMNELTFRICETSPQLKNIDHGTISNLIGEYLKARGIAKITKKYWPVKWVQTTITKERREPLQNKRSTRSFLERNHQSGDDNDLILRVLGLYFFFVFFFLIYSF